MAVFPESRFSILTLAVNDRDAMTVFYRDVIGLRCFNTKGMTMFDAGGLVFGLWERDNFAEDAGREIDPPAKFPGFATAYNARSVEEVDEIFERLKNAGVEITKPPHKTFWGGYSGYFADPEGNAWEVAYNPYWEIDSNGRLNLPAEEGA